MKIEFIVHSSKEFDSIAEFEKKLPRHTIIRIDDKDVEGYCESCDIPILEGDDFDFLEDGILICKDCKEF